MYIDQRSASRGRVLQSTGRGGLGNMRPLSFDRAVSGPDDYSDTRGRDPIPSRDPYMDISTGRGKRGHLRAPARDAAHGNDASIGASPLRFDVRDRRYDRELIARISAARDTGVHSFGRGGAGNMIRSRLGPKSCSRSREVAAYASGCGGVENMYLGGASEKDIEELDEGNDLYDPGVSVLRGGYASLTAGELPHVEGAVKPHKTYGSSGAQLLYLRHRMTRLLRGVGGDSIPEEDHHDTLGGSL